MSILKTANGSKFAVECNWFCKISQNVKNLWFLINKNKWVFRNICEFSWKIAKSSKFALQWDWIGKIPQNVQKLCVLKKDVFFLTNPLFLKKLLKITNLLYNATEWVRFLMTFEIWVFLEKKTSRLSEKNLYF